MISCKFSHLFGINTSLHYKGIHKQTLSKNLFQLYASFIYFYSKTINYNVDGRCFGLWLWMWLWYARVKRRRLLNGPMILRYKFASASSESEKNRRETRDERAVPSFIVIIQSIPIQSKLTFRSLGKFYIHIRVQTSSNSKRKRFNMSGDEKKHPTTQTTGETQQSAPRRTPAPKWFSCKGINVHDGSMKKRGRSPACYGIYREIKDVALIHALNNEKPPRYNKEQKTLDLQKNNFNHICIGSSHYKVSERPMKKSDLLVFSKDLARCRGGIDIFWSGQEKREGSVADDAAVGNGRIVEKGIEAMEAQNENVGGNEVGQISYEEEDFEEIDILEEVVEAGRYTWSLGSRTATECKNNAVFVGSVVFSREFPERLYDSASRIVNQFGPTYNNCKKFGSKWYRSFFDEDDDDYDDER